MDLSSKVPGRIIQLFVDEGYLLYPGELIAILDRNEQRGQLVASKGSTFTAKENLAALEAGSRPQEIQSAQAQYEAAVSNHAARPKPDSAWPSPARARKRLPRRARRCSRRRPITRWCLPGRARKQIAQFRAQYAQAQANLSLLRAGTRIEEINQNSAALDTGESHRGERGDRTETRAISV